jgi:high-affinity nickel permease
MLNCLLPGAASRSAALRGRPDSAYGWLAGANAAAWPGAVRLCRRHPVRPGTASVAYGLGLRHAPGADPIAGSDNGAHKLMAAGVALAHATTTTAASPLFSGSSSLGSAPCGLPLH